MRPRSSPDPLLFGTRLLLIRGTTRRTGPRGISISASMAWDLSRTGDPARSRHRPPAPPAGMSRTVRPAGRPLDGISRNLAITGLGG